MQNGQNVPDLNGVLSKLCTKCSIRDVTNKRSTWCNFCKNIAVKESWKLKTPRQKKEASLIKRYGITYDEYLVKLTEQEYKCEICKSLIKEFDSTRNPEAAQVDHCHKTNNVRGLLCSFCNWGLGCAKDDKQILENMIKYLEKYSG